MWLTPDRAAGHVARKGRRDALEPRKHDGSLYAAAITAADFDRDGYVDFAITSACGRGLDSVAWLYVYFGHGDGTFSDAVPFEIGACIEGASTADVDRNGTDDFVFAPATVLLSNADGTFQPGLHSAQTVGGLTLGLADWNHDGELDVALGTEGRVGCISQRPRHLGR